MRGLYLLGLSLVACLFISFLNINAIQAQTTYEMGSVPLVTDCAGIFVDDGGNGFPGFYSNQLGSDPQQFTICPDNAGCVIMDFGIFITENSSNLGPGDVLHIYDGPDTSSPLIGSYSGSLLNSENAFGQVFAGSGCMTFVFDENGGFSTVGWEAEWTCFTATCVTRSTLDPPVDCETAILVCDEETLNYNSNGPGIQELTNGFQGCIASGETQSAWFVININQFAPANMPLEFTISPKPGGEDYDFAVYGPMTDCDEMSAPIRCSYAEEFAAGTLLTGLRDGETDVSETPTLDDNGNPANGFVEPIIVNPGETYYIMINNFSTNSVGFDMFWGDAVENNNLLDCSICDFAVIMEDDFSICQGETFIVSPQIFKGSGFFDYTWTIDPSMPFTGDSFIVVEPPVDYSGEINISVVVNDEEVNNCEQEATITIDVQSDFQYDGQVINPVLCIGDTTDVELLGDFGTDFTIDWNLFDGTLVSGDLSTLGPLEVSWDTSGEKIVIAFLEQGDCNAVPFEFETEVFPTIETPTVLCPTLPSDSTFTWNSVEGATSYTVTVYVNGVEVSTGDTFDTEFTVEGAQGDTVQVEVLVNPAGTYCDGTSGTSEACPILGCEQPADFAIVGLNDTYCIENSSVVLLAVPPGGTFTLGGDTISSFDPAQGEGEYLVEYVFVDEELGCAFFTDFTVTVLGAITADFAMPDTICTDELATIEYTGNAGGDADFTWNFGGGTPGIFDQIGPVDVAWTSPGSYPVSLIVDANGCTSGIPVPQFITVLQAPIPPDLTCDDAPLGTASVSWTQEGGHSYVLDIYQNGTLQLSDFPVSTGNYTQGGFEDGDTLTVSVVAFIEGESYCGTSDTITLDCIVNTCLETPLSILGIEESYCLEDQLVEIATEPAGGILSTTSAGLIDTTFSIADAGVGDHTIIYNWEDEDGCPNVTEFTTTIFAVPEASFDISPNPICDGSAATITYTGTPDVDTFEWDFGPDVVTFVPQTEGPHNIVWDSPGTKTVTLIVTLNDCTSELFSADIEVIPQPETPTISCGPSTEDCVTFEWTSSDGDNGYTFNIAITPPGSPTMFDFDLSSDTPTYTRCDLEPGTEVSLSLLEAQAFDPCTAAAIADAFSCFAIDCDETLEINGLPANLCIDEGVVNFTFVAPDGAIISGDGVTQNGNSTASFDPNNAGGGTHTITLTYTDPNTGCPPYTETASIEVFALPTADFNIGGGTEFCVGDAVDINFTGSTGADSYSWNFGTGATPPSSISSNPPNVSYSSAGTKTITLEINDNGCLDDTSQEITIVEPLGNPVITCGDTDQTFVTFEWGDIGGSTGYSISYSIDSGAPITDNVATGTTSYTVSPLTPGQSIELTIIALGDAPCGDSEADSQTCVAQNCPTVNPVITNLDAEYCDDCGSPITLTATPAGGTFTIGADPTPVTEFDPCGLLGTFTINYDYTEGACDYNTSQQVTVNTRPEAAIGLSITEVCVGDPVDISFTGNAGANANYTWDFGANANPATSNVEGPHSVSWTAGGTKTITLNLDENNCTATAATTTVEVFEELVAPTVSCTQSTENSVGFSWNNVGGTGEFIYEVYINGTLDLSNQSTFDLTYDRNGLTPGDEVRIVVYAIGANICGDSPTGEQTCFAENCPVLEPTIDNLATNYCQTEGVIALTATNTGGDNTGTGEFTLDNVVITEFDTNRPAGNYTINYTYTQGSCSGSTSQQVTIDEQPVVAIAALADACIAELVEVNFDGTAPAGANFTWDFGAGAIPSTQTGIGPWEVTWDSEGAKTISLTVELNGCQDQTTIEMNVLAPLETPQVMCTEVTQNQITFEWNEVADNYSISVIVNSIPSFDDPAYTDERYVAIGLSPGDEVSVVVEPLGDVPCGNGIAGSNTCIAANCPDETLSILMDNTSFCLDEQGVLLNANPEGGIFTIDSNPTPVGDFNPALAGTGPHMIYYNYTNPTTGCPYMDSLEVNVFELPTASFDIAERACPGDAVVLEFTGLAPNTSDSGFNWNDFGGGNILSGLGGGPYELNWNDSGMKTISLELTTDNGCTATIEGTIDVTNLNLQILDVPSINQGESAEITANAESSTAADSTITYTWNNIESLSCSDCPNPTATPGISTTYTLTIEDGGGCRTSQSVLVDVIIPIPLPQLIIPNAFSPNGDGMNDIFRPIYDELILGAELKVYNRWGELLFESTDRNTYWDGMYQDEVVPVGVYAYWVVVNYVDGTSRLFAGNVTVVR